MRPCAAAKHKARQLTLHAAVPYARQAPCTRQNPPCRPEGKRRCTAAGRQRQRQRGLAAAASSGGPKSSQAATQSEEPALAPAEQQQQQPPGEDGEAEWQRARALIAEQQRLQLESHAQPYDLVKTRVGGWVGGSVSGWDERWQVWAGHQLQAESGNAS